MKNFFRAVWQFCRYLFWPRWGGKRNNSTISVNDHQKENNRIYALHREVLDAIYEAFNMMCEKDYNAFILFIGRAAILPGLEKVTGTACVIDDKLDTFYDKTRTDFYLRYLNRNYVRDGYRYDGENGIDDLHIELMIYAHLWDSTYFLKALVRIASIVSGKGYDWDPTVNWWRKEEKMKECIIEPLKRSGLKLGDLIEKCYIARVRNAFAHSLYNIDTERRIIYFRSDKDHCKKGESQIFTISFEYFQKIFLLSSILMNKMENELERNHDSACEKNTALTEVFTTPDGVDVQVYAQMVKRGTYIIPEFSLVKSIK